MSHRRADSPRSSHRAASNSLGDALPLRVCHLAYTFYENDNRVIRYAQDLSERGASVDVVALRRAGQSRADAVDGVRLYRIQRRAVNERHALVYLVKIIWFALQSAVFLSFLQVRRRYDVVHVHNVPDFLVFAAVIPKLLGARVILDIHDILPELYAGKFGAGEDTAVFRSLLLIERLSCRFADHVIVANHLWHAKLSDRAVSTAKCTPILNYPDLKLFRSHGDGGPARGFVFLYPGTLNHHQGLDVGIRAFSMAADRMPGAEFHIYGEGPARLSLEQLIRERDLGDRVKIMDRVPISEVPRLMASAAAGVVPKRADGFGNEAFSTKTLEFMACGVPVIVSRTAVDAYYFNESVVHFCAPGDDADLARALVWVYEHRADHAEWIQRARAFAVLQSWQQRAGDYHSVLDRLAVPSRGRVAVTH